MLSIAKAATILTILTFINRMPKVNTSVVMVTEKHCHHQHASSPLSLSLSPFVRCHCHHDHQHNRHPKALPVAQVGGNHMWQCALGHLHSRACVHCRRSNDCRAHTSDRQGGALRCPLMPNPTQGAVLPRLLLRLSSTRLICLLQHFAGQLVSVIVEIYGSSADVSSEQAIPVPTLSSRILAPLITSK